MPVTAQLPKSHVLSHGLVMEGGVLVLRTIVAFAFVLGEPLALRLFLLFHDSGCGGSGVRRRGIVEGLSGGCGGRLGVVGSHC